MMTDDFASHLQDWAQREARAERLIPMIGQLYRDHGVVTSIHGRRLLNLSPIDIIKAHKFARQASSEAYTVEDTQRMLGALLQIAPGPASLDLARLHAGYTANSDGQELVDWLRRELVTVISDAHERAAPTDVVLYGFGRIGRLIARILIGHAGNGAGLRLRAIVVRSGSDDDLIKRASLLRRDSVHGAFEGTITVNTEDNTILANGTLIRVIYSNDPASIDYTDYGIHGAIVVDNTGRWRDEDGLRQHLACPGVARVLLTAPGKGSLKNIVHGINHDTIHDDDEIITAASCTTNAITPVLHVLDTRWGIRHGHIETVHAYTNDQNLIDNFHKGNRRGRAAALNMVITETGAATAVSKALPELAGKLTGSAIRVPTPNVSLAILNVALEESTTVEDVNSHLRWVSLHTDLRQQIDYIDSPEVVSTDFVGSIRAGIVDGKATVCTGHNAVVYVWYDNEFGYSAQVIRVLETMAGTHPRILPARAPVTART